MVVIDVVIAGDPVTVRLRYGMYETEFTGSTILDILTSPILQQWKASGTKAYAEDGGVRAFTPCAPDRRLRRGEIIEMVRGKPR